MPRYFVLDAPPGRVGSAFLPGMPISPKALKWGFWGNPDQLQGHPGDRPIGIPDPTIPGTGPRVSAVNGIFSSPDTPDFMFPSLYYVQGTQEHPPVGLYRSNNMPVPSGDVGYGHPFDYVGGTQTSRVGMVAARTPRVGGTEQTGWPGVAPHFPWGNRSGRKKRDR